MQIFVWRTSVSQLPVDDPVLFPGMLREVATFPCGLCHYLLASMQQGSVVANTGCYMYGRFLRHHCALSNPTNASCPERK